MFVQFMVIELWDTLGIFGCSSKKDMTSYDHRHSAFLGTGHDLSVRATLTCLGASLLKTGYTGTTSSLVSCLWMS